MLDRKATNLEEANLDEQFLKVYSNLVAGNWSFDEFFDKYYNKDFTYKKIAEKLQGKRALKHIFVKKILDYYDALDTVYITQAQVDFIADKSIKLKFSDFNTDTRSTLAMCDDKDYIDISHNVYKKLGLLQTGFDRRINYLSYVVDGKARKVDDNALDQALAYAKSKNVYRCNYTISRIAKDIVCGNIDYSKQTDEEMQGMQKTVLELIQESQNSTTQQQN